ncbi:MAG TPA: hypothetical protein VNB06_22215 [Thermoanaerobaculia bacterium]|nr:hypothetical protein [Thermoanaerobaculia bacterium]
MAKVQRRIVGHVFAVLALLGAGIPALGLAQNPAASGFDAEGSDPRAIAIADEVMAAMGGRAAWDATRYLSWNFFGMRTHVWDKWTGDLRFQQGDQLVLMNVNTKEGRVFRAGEEVTGEDRDKALDGGYKAWINDSYWLLMPYKLKDSGVTLGFKGEGKLADDRPADVLQLTFAGVGVTPENKYDVYVSRDRRLVEQWSFYAQAVDAEPRFTTPWAKWERQGQVLLSGDRGQRQLTDIRVFEDLPRAVFEDPAPVELP